MPMQLHGSCQCGGVEYSVLSHTPVPYQLCACGICRKVGGYSGSVNLGGISASLKIKKGEELIKKYTATKDQGTPQATRCSSQRSFCSECSTMLWLWDAQWPELIHPFASSVDTELPAPPRMVCVMGGSKPDWVRWPEGDKSVHEFYGETSLEGWHRKNGLFVE
ncbi:MAG: hypothetical protein M1819_000244 [Sarea resinae]|nr:MAG: hypothetical protein M1819_000244 [Sarea resinae]